MDLQWPPARPAALWRRAVADAVDEAAKWCLTEGAQRLTGWRTPKPQERWPPPAELKKMDSEEMPALVRRHWSEVGRRWAEHQRAHIGEARRAEALSLLVSVGYAVAGALSGGSLGKRALGLRVVDARGGRPRLLQTVVRDGVFASRRLLLLCLPDHLRPPPLRASSLSSLFDAVDDLWALVDGERRALHDLLAGTRVVQDLRRAG